MKLKFALSTNFLINVFYLSCLFIGCDNNDTNETEAEAAIQTTSTDSLAAITTTVDASMISDSNSLMTATHGTAPATLKGTAKPNPAKKGLKGKVTAKPEMAPGSKDAKTVADASGVYPVVDVMASFPGGTNGLQDFFDRNLEYPADATNEGVEGTVRVTFIVDENGKIISPQVGGENLGYGLEAEALRVINRMPAWTPAKLKGKNVKTRITLPIRFQLI
jgi:periplasmic protein TonB